MADFTSHLNLYKPGGGSTGTITPDEVVDIDRVNQNMDVIDAAIEVLDDFRVAQNGRNQQYRGVAANIGSVSGMTRGDTYRETDGDFRLWEYDGTNWVAGENGLYLIRPTTVVNGTVNAAGEIVPTAASSCSLNGVLSSRFRSYLIVFSLKGSSSASLRAYLRNAGVDLTTAVYVVQGFNSNAGALSSASGTVGDIPLSAAAAGFHTGELSLSDPAKAAKKTGRATVGTDTTLTRITSFYASTVDANTYDGITFSLNAGTFDVGHANFIKVYGRQ